MKMVDVGKLLLLMVSHKQAHMSSSILRLFNLAFCHFSKEKEKRVNKTETVLDTVERGCRF